MSRALDAALAEELAALKARGLYRTRKILETGPGAVVRMSGREYLSFCSNDYLGLAGHPQITAALQRSSEHWRVGSGASHLISGHSAAHHALEEELAAFVGRPRALLFSTGYMANLGIASALLGRGDVVVEDRWNHASLLDAGLATRARFLRYAHADPADLARRLARTGRRRVVMTDGIFSMDGDLAPLPELAGVCRERQAVLVVDDAHGLGVIGASGRGTLEHFGLSLDDVPVLMGTLGKALGTFGAFVAGSDALIETLIQRARTYIYTTALPPAIAEATREALRIAVRESWRRDRLHENIARLRRGADALGLHLAPSRTAIQPLIFGTAARAVAAADVLLTRGLLVGAVRPPTVPAGTSRLRITLSAAHDPEQIDCLLDALRDACAGS